MCAMNPRLLRPKASGFKYQSLRTGLVAYWPLNETAASGDVTAKDESGKGNNLTSNNSVLSAAGKIGNARDFVAANSEFLSIASNADMQFGNKDWTLALWFNADDWGSYQVVAKDASGGRELECAMSVSGGSNGIQAFVYHSDGTGVSFLLYPFPPGLAAGVWHFLALRCVASTGVVTLRVNNTVVTNTRAAGKTFGSTGTAFTLGSRIFNPFQQYYNGLIDECARWNRALSDAELNELYNNGNGINLGQRA